MSNNEWFERGELPPVGTECEVLNTQLQSAQWEKCKILFMGKFKCVYDSESCNERVGMIGIEGYIQFRPIKTERERAIEEMHIIANQGSSCASIGAIEKLYDAGFKR